MIENIKIIYDRERKVLAKRRVYIISYGIITTVLSLFVLIAINRIITLARREGIFNYYDVLFIHERLIDILCAISLFASVFFIAPNVNDDINNNMLDHMLSTDINANEIILAKYISGILSTIELSIAILPIIMLSMFYGGISFFKLLFVFILICLASSFVLSFTLFISYLLRDNTRSIFISVIFAMITLAFSIMFRNVILGNMSFYMILCAIFIVSSVCFIYVSIRLIKP